MFSSLLSAPCELKLHLLQHVVFLRPPTRAPTEDALPTSTDEVARGLVELYVPHDRRIGGIRVKLRAVQSVAVLPDQRDMINFAGATPIGWEDTVLMEKVVEIGLPASKRHATVPGDDTITSAERPRGRSRAARSRGPTPVSSRAGSPRISLEDAPPDYDDVNGSASSTAANARPAMTPSQSSTQNGSGGFGAMMRAMSRGRPSSRPGSGPGSRGPSRPASRAASRDTSPVGARDRNGVPADAGPTSPQRSSVESPGTPSQLRRQLSDNSPNAERQSDIETLSGHLSRTGLSNGRAGAHGPHPHVRDRDDYFGLIPASPHLTGRRDAANVSAASSGTAANSRSVTLSPSARAASRGRDESRSRLIQIGRKGNRNQSADPRPAAGATGSSEGSDGLFLQKGVHGFEFAFIIPGGSPPYERSPFGRVRYVVKATAFGAGRAKSNLEAWRDMFPVVNPASDGGPVPLTVLYSDIHSTVGLLSIACTSNNISVGGIFNVDIHSPTPPPDLIVYLVRVSVETSTELRTRKKGKQHVPTQRHKLFEKGWVPPRPNDPHGQGDGRRSEGVIRDPTKTGSRADDAWTVQGIARMPNDNIVRSTTTSGTRASIRFSHQLLVEVVHSRAPEKPGQDRKLKVFALRQPITLPSCCVAYDAVVLPPYTANDDSARPADMPYDIGSQDNGIQHRSHDANANGPSSASALSASRRTSTAANLHGSGHEYCVCGQTFADLSERERGLMPARPYADLPLDALSHRKIGELPENTGGSSGVGAIGNALRRSTSRSSSASREGRERSSSRHSLNLARSLSRARSPSVGSTTSRRGRNTSMSRGRGGAGNVISYPTGTVGAGERGEGVIRTMSRGARSNELPGETQSHPPHGIVAPPPAYDNVVEEESGEEEEAEGVEGEEGERSNQIAAGTVSTSNGADPLAHHLSSNSSFTTNSLPESVDALSSLSSGRASNDEHHEQAQQQHPPQVKEGHSTVTPNS